MITVRFPSAGDIESVRDLATFLRMVQITQRRIASASADVAFMIGPMFSKEDRFEGINRRAAVRRAVVALGLNAWGGAVLSKTAAIRLRREYPHYFGERRQTRRAPQASFKRAS